LHSSPLPASPTIASSQPLNEILSDLTNLVFLLIEMTFLFDFAVLFAAGLFLSSK
jgi:hypothetical protein